MLVNQYTALLADVLRLVWLALRPLQLCEVQRLIVTTVRTRDLKTPLVRGFEFTLDPGNSLDRRRAASGIGLVGIDGAVRFIYFRLAPFLGAI